MSRKREFFQTFTLGHLLRYFMLGTNSNVIKIISINVTKTQCYYIHPCNAKKRTLIRYLVRYMHAHLLICNRNENLYLTFSSIHILVVIIEPFFIQRYCEEIWKKKKKNSRAIIIIYFKFVIHDNSIVKTCHL